MHDPASPSPALARITPSATTMGLSSLASERRVNTCTPERARAAEPLSPLSPLSSPRPSRHPARMQHTRSHSISMLSAMARPARHKRQGTLAADLLVSRAAPDTHPEFCFGDAVLVCKGTAFRIPAAILRDACNVFADLTPGSPLPVDQAEADVLPFLRFITSNPATLDLDLGAVRSIQTILIAWHAKMSIATALCEYVAAHAARLIACPPDRAAALALVRAIADMRFVELWAALLDRLRADAEWRALLDPARLTPTEREDLGAPARGAVTFILGGDLDTCAVYRDENNLFLVVRTIGHHQALYADNML